MKIYTVYARKGSFVEAHNSYVTKQAAMEAAERLAWDIASQESMNITFRGECQRTFNSVWLLGPGSFHQTSNPKEALVGVAEKELHGSPLEALAEAAE